MYKNTKSQHLTVKDALRLGYLKKTDRKSLILKTLKVERITKVLSFRVAAVVGTIRLKCCPTHLSIQHNIILGTMVAHSSSNPKPSRL